MDDNVIPFTKRPSSAEQKAGINGAEVAERHRQELAGRLAADATRIRDRLTAETRLPQAVREHFGRIVFRMFAELDLKQKGLVARILNETGNGGGNSTKCRGRFAQDKPLSTPLAASGKKWVAVVSEAGRHLRGAHQALVDLVTGTVYAPDTQPMLGPIGDDAAETATLLHLLAGWVSRRHRLQTYFEALRGSEYAMVDGDVGVPEVLPQAADPDLLADGYWLGEDAGAILPFIPQIRIADRALAVPAVGLLGDLQGKPDDPAVWERIAAESGVADLQVDLEMRLSLGIAPLRPDDDPVACFLVTPVFRIEVWSTVIEIAPAAKNIWIPFRFEHGGGARWSAIRVPEWPAEVSHWVEHAGETRTDAVSSATVQSLLGDRLRYGFGRLHLADPDDAGTEDGGRLPVGAPSRTLMAAVQRNLAHAPEPEKLSVLLDECARNLVERLHIMRLRERGRFDNAMAPLLAAWRDENPGE